MFQPLKSYYSPNIWLSGKSSTSAVCFARFASDDPVGEDAQNNCIKISWCYSR